VIVLIYFKYFMKPERSGKRQSILKGAIKLFGLTHDVKKASLEDIAKEAGVSPTTIYNIFGTRDNLVCEVAKYLVQELLEQSRAMIHSDVPFSKKISDLLSFKTDLINSNGALLNKMLSQDESILDEATLLELKPLTTEFIESGKRQGYINPSLSTQTLAEYFDIFRAGIASKPEIATHLKEDTLFIKEITQIILQGFLTKEIAISTPDIAGHKD